MQSNWNFSIELSYMIGTLIFLIIFGYLIGKLIRYIAIKVINKKLVTIFTNNYCFIPGVDYLSILKFKWSNSFADINIENLVININFSGFFNRSNTPIIRIFGETVHFHLKELPKISSNKNINNKKSVSYEKWFLQRIAILFFTTILKSFSIHINNIQISYANYSVKVTRITSFYKRYPQTVKFHFSIQDILFKLSDPMLRIPLIRLSLSMSIQSLFHCMWSFNNWFQWEFY